ncbi:BLOC-2 complex member HPS3-like [Brachionichthys hirsutus]|uniref:BLOC-2 complex member HPS3-like n=1 Tax=Brachionichthys hirsutus TaxID=412623 RepID=UPI003604878D
MVHVYNCHPFSSQHIVQVEQEPGLVCCGGGALFVVATGGCKVEAYDLEQGSCPLICRFATMGAVASIQHSKMGDYLVTIEEKNSATYLRVYTNWRHQAEERARVGVRLLGHLLRGGSMRGGAQMEIIEIPLSERPVAVACCAVTGDLLVGCGNTLVLFTLRRQNQNSLILQGAGPGAHQNPGPSQTVSILDFERSVILHLSELTPKQVALCDSYVAMQTELEVLVLKLEASSEPEVQEESPDINQDDQPDFLVLPRHQELLGDRAKDCGVHVSVERTGLEDGGRSSVSYVLFRSLTPDSSPGGVAEEILLQSLQLRPLFTRHQSAPPDGPACVFCFFSLPSSGYLYSLKGCVERLSVYQYPERVLAAALTDQLLHVITSEFREHNVLTGIFQAVGIDPTTTPALGSLLSRPLLSRKWASPPPRGSSAAGHGWNLYVIDTVPPLTLYRELVEYSRRYVATTPQAQSLRHLLSEAHLLLRAAALQQQNREGGAAEGTAGGRELDDAFRQNCAQLGDSFSRACQKDCHLALPYYRMSGLSVEEVVSRNRPLPSSPRSHGPGFLFYLKHHLLEETAPRLSQEAADEVVAIFSQSEPSQLVGVCVGPAMANMSPARTLQALRRAEATAGVSVATMMLLLDELPQFTQLMERHAEMLLLYGFMEEPRLLLHGGGGGGGQHGHARPTALARQLVNSQPGLLVAAMVALHASGGVQLQQADHVFKALGCERCLQVDFWEAILMASSQEDVVQELLFRVASVYIDRLTDARPDPPRGRGPLKSADILINSCCHYGALYPWLTVLNPARTSNAQHQEAPHKLQSLLCGPSLSVGAVSPLLDGLPEETSWGFSLHLLRATRRGQYDSCIEKLLDRCPQAIIAYGNHHFQDEDKVLWWTKLLPELCNRTRAAADNGILLAALKETVVVVAMEMSPAEFLELIPDDGAASYFLPHLLTCCQRHLLT